MFDDFDILTTVGCFDEQGEQKGYFVQKEGGILREGPAKGYLIVSNGRVADVTSNYSYSYCFKTEKVCGY